MATREILSELARAYTATSGQLIQCEAVGGVDAAKRVQADEQFDLVVLASNAIDKLIADNKVLEPRTDLMRSGIAIAVRAGASAIDIGSEQAVKQAVLNAKSVSYSTGPSGVYLEKLFERWGILQSIKPKIIVPPPGTPVGTLVANGDCELGFQQLSELMSLSGIRVLGPLPDAIQSITTFSGAVARTSLRRAASQKALLYLASAETAIIKQKYGMTAA